MSLVTWPCRNVLASGPVSASLPRSERSTRPHASVSARWSVARVSAVAAISQRGYETCLTCSASTSARPTCASRSVTAAAPVAAGRARHALAARRAASELGLRGPGRRRRRARDPGRRRLRRADRRRRRAHRRAAAALLEEALGVPVVLENDLNLAALAEHRVRGVADLAFIGVGTGVGMGIVAGGGSCAARAARPASSVTCRSATAWSPARRSRPARGGRRRRRARRALGLRHRARRVRRRRARRRRAAPCCTTRRARWRSRSGPSRRCSIRR